MGKKKKKKLKKLKLKTKKLKASEIFTAPKSPNIPDTTLKDMVTGMTDELYN